MFDVKLEPLLEEARNLGEIPNQLLNSEDTLQRAADILKGMSMPDDIVLSIRKTQVQMNESAAIALRMGYTLENIWYQYHRSEWEIVDFCEQSPVIWRREPVGYRNLTWLYGIL